VVHAARAGRRRQRPCHRGQLLAPVAANLRDAHALAQVSSTADRDHRHAQRVRLLAVADAARMKSEAEVLKDNPLLIQKIIAERLSDKVQIMMVPMDGKGFFANDVLKAATGGNGISFSPNGR